MKSTLLSFHRLTSLGSLQDERDRQSGEEDRESQGGRLFLSEESGKIKYFRTLRLAGPRHPPAAVLIVQKGATV